MVRYVAVGWEDDEIEEEDFNISGVKVIGGMVVGVEENNYSFNNF